MRTSSNELQGNCSHLNGLLNEESFRFLLTLRKNTWCLVAIRSWMNMNNCFKCSNTSILMGPCLVLEGISQFWSLWSVSRKKILFWFLNKISSTSSCVASAIGTTWFPDVLTTKSLKIQWKLPVDLTFESCTGFALGWVNAHWQQRLLRHSDFSFCSYLLFSILILFKSWHNV